ncbi:MAG: site-2 protease family protein [Desulfobacterales bacterium]|nr:site-2 protease family protein [Desulfobacterales bacterium]
MKTSINFFSKMFFLIWIIVPVVFILIYPSVKSYPHYLKILNIGLFIYVLLFSVIIHELAHGYAARMCGDYTADQAGRLTLNPIPHISIVGSILVPLTLFLLNVNTLIGWAKPVPFNPVNLRQHPRDQVMLAIAGPLSNFTLSYLCFSLFLLAGFMFKFLYPASSVSLQFDITSPISFPGISFEAFWIVMFQILNTGILINLALGVFNLIPFPPLDGSWLLKALLPQKASLFLAKIQNYGFILLIVAVQFNLLDIFFYPVSIIYMLFFQLTHICLG